MFIWPMSVTVSIVPAFMKVHIFKDLVEWDYDQEGEKWTKIWFSKQIWVIIFLIYN